LALILEVDYHVTNHDHVPHQLRPALGARILMNGGAGQVPDPVGDAQPERAADDNPQYGAAYIATADAGTEGAG